MIRKRPAPAALLPVVKLAVASWPGLLASPAKAVLEKILPGYIRERRWFGGKARSVTGLKISGSVPLGGGSMLALLAVSYSRGARQTYVLPLAWKEETAALKAVKGFPGAAIARLELGGKRGLLYDAVYDEFFQKALLSLFLGRSRPCRGPLRLVAERNMKALKKAALKRGLRPRVLKGEQSNTSIIYGAEYFFKLFRRLENGLNPDVEITARLTERGEFRNMPPYIGSVSLHRGGRSRGVVGLLQGYSPAPGDSWSYALGQVNGYYKRVLARPPGGGPVPLLPDPIDPAPHGVPLRLKELIGGTCLEMISLLGRRTAEMHLALASAGSDPDFRPVLFSRRSRNSVYLSMREQASSSLRLLTRKLKDLPRAARPDAGLVLRGKRAVAEAFGGVMEGKASFKEIRVHGDFHLGQVLFTGRDFVIIDFEGEPAKPAAERRLKRCALRDVAGMLRSFHYAAWAPFLLHNNFSPGDRKRLGPWAEFWCSCVSGAYLRSYFRAAAGAAFLPAGARETASLLRAFVMEKAVYELSYELNNRPAWVGIPLKGLLRSIRPGTGAGKAGIRLRSLARGEHKRCR